MTIAPVIPDNAPFSPEQRSWLNGFFAGLLSLEGGPQPIDTRTALGAMAHSAPELLASPAEADDGAPWHDQGMPMAERMALAEGRPLRRRLMAAMAQQDCGQCGYLCESYADALAKGEETRLNLCAPGGKETARMLKTLAQEIAGTGPAPAGPAAQTGQAAVPAAPAAPGRSRDNPVTATFLGAQRLNRAGSEKETSHVEFDLSGSGLTYEAGDSFGIYPMNDPALVAEILAAIDAPADFPIAGRPLSEVLAADYSLSPAPDMLFTLFSYATRGDQRARAKALAAGSDPGADGLDVLAALRLFPGVHPDPEAFVECLEPLQPRLYSISSSPKAAPGRLSLTVDGVRWHDGARERRGVCSSLLGARLAPGAQLRVYVQEAHGFRLPQDGAVPIVMIGPGTGIAPFRAFLQERLATGASGGAWLFFGHQRADCDFFYREELEALQAQGALTRLSLAWSRERGQPKTYVQDRMRAEGAELFAWLERGAHLYVCGDARRMAVDVDRALTEIVAAHGGRDEAGARAYVAALAKARRYQRDVY